MVSSLDGDGDKGSQKSAKINGIINSHLKDKNINPIILGQSIAGSDTIKEFAEKYNISIGKMTFIRNLMILNPDFELEDLVHLSLEELLELSRELGLDLNKIIDYDEDILEEKFQEEDLGEDDDILIDDDIDDDVKLAKEKNTSPGKLKIIKRIIINL